MKKLFLYLGCFLWSVTTLLAQENNFTLAQSLATSGEHAKANTILESHLLQFPEDFSAQLLQAHNLSWWKHYDEAITAFDRILKRQPETLDALVGKAYAYFWSGQTSKSIPLFKQALSINGQYADAQKGLAAAYLSVNKGSDAAAVFRQLIIRFPAETSYRIGLGKAMIIEERRKEARTIFQQILSEDPGHSEAQFLLAEVTQPSSLLELDVWGGYSKVGEENDWGLRQIQLSYQFNKKYTIIAKYDNTLSLDNRDFILLNERAPAGWLGGYISWNDRLGTRLDVGTRFFDQRDDQLLFKGEQIFYFRNGYAFKTGGFVGLADDRPTEWYLNLGGHIPVSSIFALEPGYYYGRDNHQFDGQHRAVLAGQFKWPTGLEMTLGAFFGKADVGLENDKENIKGGYLLVFYPLTKNIWSEFAINHEDGVFTDATVFSFGLRFRWE